MPSLNQVSILVHLLFIAPVAFSVDVKFLAARGNMVEAVEVYMYRASATTSWYAMENVDLADISGVLKYVHTEVIAEHTQSRPERLQRKYNIDRITKWKVHFKNPDSIVNDPAAAIQVDFGQYITYDYGQGTNTDLEERLATYGSYVGVQEQNTNKQYAVDHPYHWYSLPGFCSNLPYLCTNGWTGSGMNDDRDKCNHDPQVYTAKCTPDAPCPSKGTRKEPRETGDAKTSCVKGSGGNVIMGGLCGTTGGHPNFSMPTGAANCIYSYDYANRVEVNLDELSGITQQDCYSGKCKDWKDFRYNCKDDHFRRKFVLTRDDAGAISSARVETFAYCVEYDINPWCEQDCNAKECLDLPEDEKEVGLPFWKGRCDSMANNKRAEALAKAAGVSDADTNHALVESRSPEAENFQMNCDRKSQVETLVQCTPYARNGGPYCTREWAGVCSPCFIPKTALEFSNDKFPYCPYNITQGEYKRTPNCFRGSCCQTRKPSDLCCLYYDSCDIKLAEVESRIDVLPIDEDSLRLVEATRNSELVLKFMKRLIPNMGGNSGVITEARIQEKENELKDIAYWQWGHAPTKLRGNTAEEKKMYTRMKDLEEKLEKVFPEVTTGVPTSAPTSPAPTSPPAQPTTSPTAAPTSPPAQAGSAGGGSNLVIIVLIIMLLGAGVSGGFLSLRQRQARDHRMSGGIGGGSQAQQEMVAVR